MYLPNLKCKSNHLLLILILGGNQSGWEFIETRVQGFVLKKRKTHDSSEHKEGN